VIGKTISHYRIIEKLGEGGMGVVYRAEDLKLKRTVALKFLPPEWTRDADARARFLREAQAAAALNHPNICTVHEISEADGQAFIAMECVAGKDLRTTIRSAPLTLNDSLDIAIQIAEGLAAAHERDIVHRDIKPANIVVTPKGRVKIMDFGLARMAGGAQLTRIGTTVGTVAYMSPEQARGGDIDHRTDIWSLGVVLYEMVAGRRPFRGARDQAIIYSILNDVPEPVSSARPEVPAALDSVIATALAKEPAGRYHRTDELVADLTDLRGESGSSVRTRRMDSSTTEASIAVLPFADMSPDKDQEYFCDGMAEELINALTNIEGLQVSSRTSAFQFKGQGCDIHEIGRKLNVQTVLEGSVRKAGTRLRITAQLIKVADGYHLWSERFDRDMQDVFAIQDEISLAIVDKLKVRLLGEEKPKLVNRHTENLDAYNLYLRGRWFWNKRTDEGLGKAIECFERAIEIAPDYALAYAGMADAYNDFLNYSIAPPEDAYPKAKEAALKALELDDALAEAHAALGSIMSEQEWDWDGAEREFERAIELNANCAVAHHGRGMLKSYTRQHDEAIESMKRALELDPFSLPFNRNTAIALEMAGRYDEALEVAKRTTEMDPDYMFVHFVQGIIYMMKSMYEEALAEFELEERAFKGRYPLLTASIATTYAKSGRTQDAERILDDLRSASPRALLSPFCVAQVCFALGRKDEGFEWLEKAYEERDRWLRLVALLDGPSMAGDDPRLAALLKKIGLEK